MPTAISETLAGLRRMAELREQKRAPVRAARIVGRNSDGTAQLQRLDGECVARGGVSGYAGEIVAELPSLVDRRGTTGVGALERRGTYSTYKVTSVTPSILPRGSVGLVVTVTGVGLSATMVYAFGIPGTRDGNPDVTITAVNFISSTSVELTVNVAADATYFRVPAPLFYDDPLRP